MKDYFRFFDKITFMLMLLLCITGIFLIYSAGHSARQTLYLKQMLWLLVSLIAFILVFAIKTEVLFRNAHWIMLAVIAGLAMQFFAGSVISGTRSWFRVGFFHVQVSEFVKIPLTLLLAKYLSTIEFIGMRQFCVVMAYIGVPVVLIILQPDLGVSFILCSYLLIILLLKRINAFVLLFSLFFAAAILFLGWTYFLKPYQRSRIVSFLNPGKYSQTIGYHINQSKIAIGSGGLAGKGYLQGSQSRYQFLPKRHTDFIISVLGEEMGFIGIGFIVLIYILFFYRQLRFMYQTDEEFYYVYLFNGLIFFQLLINATMAIGLFPVLGISLPFISYGGSSLLSFFIGEAVLFRIKINSFLT